MEFARYAVYFTPKPGDFARAGAAWLGWDIQTGQPVSQPLTDLNLAELTQRPRKYGFHATLRAPFALAPDQTEAQLSRAIERVSAAHSVVPVGPLDVATLGRFMALVPRAAPLALSALASGLVTALDGFRPSLSAQDLARKDKPYLSDPQRANLRRWGYPHVHDAFRFHMTLTGPVPKFDQDLCLTALQLHLLPHVPEALTLDDLTLVGERSDGMFQVIARFPLAGQSVNA